jgi:hypothetical protein
MKIRTVGAELLMPTDRQTDRNTRFSQFLNAPKKDVSKKNKHFFRLIL